MVKLPVSKQAPEIVMKKQTWFIFFLLSVLFLAACGQAKSTSSAEADASISDIYTAVGLTLAANNTLTASPQPVDSAVVLSPAATLPPTTTLPPTESFPALTLTPYPTPTYEFSNIVACNNSVYVKDVTIPDGTILKPGETFKKTWQLKNTGTCRWTEGYSIAFISGYSLDGQTTTIDKRVAAGKTANISISLTAPEVEGAFNGYWLLTDESGTGFGQLINVQIVVSYDD